MVLVGGHGHNIVHISNILELRGPPDHFHQYYHPSINIDHNLSNMLLIQL